MKTFACPRAIDAAKIIISLYQASPLILSVGGYQFLIKFLAGAGLSLPSFVQSVHGCIRAQAWLSARRSAWARCASPAVIPWHAGGYDPP